MKCPHCDTPIDEHEANRCLDAWVAEAVYDLTTQRIRDSRMKRAFITIKGSVPPYSTDIAAAWEVVLNYTGRQYHVRLDGEDAFAFSAWSCAIYAPIRDEDDGPIGEGLDTSKDLNVRLASAPLAICRAALKAVGDD